MDSIYDNTARVDHEDPSAEVEFGSRDPLEVLSTLTVYVEFTAGRHHRRPMVTTVPGHAGQWVCAYSSLARLQTAQNSTEVEYSPMRGAYLLTIMPEHAGIWFDRLFPGGRPIMLPTSDP